MATQQGTDPVTAAAAALGKLRWKGVSASERKRAAKKAAAARMTKMTAKERSEIARIAGESITPEAAKERAMKAWATRRKNAAKAG